MTRSGLDIFLSQPELYAGRRIALIANHTSLTYDLKYSWDELRKKGLDLVRIFSPEHGIFGTEQDQVAVSREVDFDLEVRCLYGNDFNSLTPSEELLKDIDLVLFDIQDIGSRYYTYLNTLVLFMKMISGMGIELVVLDRPNPINGIDAEGPFLDKRYESFVGILPVPVRHSLTAGETAMLAMSHFMLDIELSVVKMEGWQRHFYYEDTGMHWVMPSPNMPFIETALVYPGMCLVEGMDASEGRGTTRPFETFGADYIRPYEFASELNSVNLPGVYFRPIFYKPVFNKLSGVTAGGCFIHVTDRKAFRPFLSGVAIVHTMCRMYRQTKFLHGVYEFNSIYPAFDLLAGSSRIREMILSGLSIDEIAASWKSDETIFADNKQKYLLY